MVLLLRFVFAISTINDVQATKKDCKIEENNGYLKYVCHEEGSITEYKCLYSDEFYIQNDFHDEIKYFYNGTNICQNDPHFYQACDNRLGGKVTNKEVLCENYYCKGTGQYSGRILTPLGLSVLGKCNVDCANTVLNKEGCNDEKVALPSGKLVRPRDICNDVCDDAFNCEDEANCNGFLYGKYCLRSEKLHYIPPWGLCNSKSKQNCDGGEDKENCTVTSSTDSFCRHIRTRQTVPVHNNTRCGTVQRSDYAKPGEKFVTKPQLYCVLDEIAAYQTNCSDPARVALTCEINGYTSSVSRYILCFDDTMSVCDDHIDSSCYSTKSCKVHKHLLCDENKDCDDKADETHPICLKKTEGTCKRRVGVGRELPIPISWLRDGVWDCVDGIDETAEWPKCGVGKTFRYMASAETQCKNVFICRYGSPGYELLDDLCDGLENCGNENTICSISSRSQSLTTKVSTTNMGLTKTLSFCRKGLRSLELFISTCVDKGFMYPDGNIFGMETKTSVIVPHSKQSCDYMYGEQYLYTSCTGQCSDTSCPLRNIPRYEVCPDQFPDRVGTIVNNEYLIFLTKSFGTVYSNRFFVCTDNKTCIDYSKVCDLVHDCEDGSDEGECTNHFQCKSSGKLLPKTKKCDGQIECADLSDECNEKCSKNLLEGYILKGLTWLIGLLAIVANLIIIGKSLGTIKRCKTSVTLINRILIIMIAMGDFFIGCYLLIIAIYDGIFFKQDYCEQRITWITSYECSVIGVLSTIGSQISLFSMTGLSIVRIYGIWNSMKIPGEVKIINVFKIAAAILFLILFSTTIAVVPILEGFEDFFVNGVKFSKELKIFIGSSDKATVTKVIQAYHGRTKDTTLSWKMLIKVVREMFSRDLDYEDLTERVDKVDFFGNDGVCLFKYFVQNQDPQRLFVWSILVLNFFCFVLISISYLFIGILSRRSSRSLGRSSGNYRQIAERNNRMNRRIAIIIATDFLCWVPFILICILHSVEVIDATLLYSIFSMVILPINSVINPLLYDDVVTKIIRAPTCCLAIRISCPAIFRRFYQRASPAPAVEITLQQRYPDFEKTADTTYERSTELHGNEIRIDLTPKPRARSIN
ncbi:hypothetical protein ACHWQZ_G019123 [Mnemiopsis leidyi]